MRKVKFTDLSYSWLLNLQLQIAARRVIRSGVYLHGREVRKFEDEFSDRFHTSNSVAVGNGFDALQIILRAYGIGPGKSVIVPTISPLPVWMAVTAVGAKVIPVDPDPSTLVMTEDRLPMIPYADAIIVVHLFGYPADVTAIKFKAKQMYGNMPLIIEDCCQAHGSTRNNMACGTFGHAAAFSFYPTKNLGALGDGGMFVTYDYKIASICREIAFYGSGNRPGVNSRMDEIQAAFLRVKLRYLDYWNSRRNANADRYWYRLVDYRGINMQPGNPGHSWHQFVIRVKNRDALAQHLAENGVETMVHYPRQAGDNWFYNMSTPFSILTSNMSLSLPIGPHIRRRDVDYVCDLIGKFSTRGWGVNG